MPQDSDPKLFDTTRGKVLVLLCRGPRTVNELMEELVTIKSETHPVEILFVADAMTGQDAVRSAEEFHARVGITLTTVLTITTLIVNSYGSVPKVSYLKALDVYLFTCFIVVFASLIGMSSNGVTKLDEY